MLFFDSFMNQLSKNLNFLFPKLQMKFKQSKTSKNIFNLMYKIINNIQNQHDEYLNE